MGIQSAIRFPSDSVPSWDMIRTKIAETGDPPRLRMIDGMPAFPDEVPESSWKELRIGLEGTMATLRRDGEVIALVTWGSADPALEAARNRIRKALTSLGGLFESES